MTKKKLVDVPFVRNVRTVKIPINKRTHPREGERVPSTGAGPLRVLLKHSFYGNFKVIP